MSISFLSGCTSLSTLFFYPQRSLVATPQEAQLDYQNVWLRATDGTQLHAWWIPAQGDVTDTRTMLLYIHGNAENISTHSRSIYWLPQQGVSVLALDYRGFGASSGQAKLPDVLQDLEAAVVWMKQEYPNKELMILGQSIGSALAINFAAQAADKYQVQGLILDASFTGFATAARSAMSQSLLGWLVWPFTVLIPSQWDPIKHVDKIDLPVLLMHSPTDNIIPYRHGKKLHKRWQQAYPEQQLCWLDAKGRHVMSYAFPELKQATLIFITHKNCAFTHSKSALLKP
ncbi:alpha/beta fold hydrolase [Denitrificimonas sp. JX-1]|uniref:Alpha/beta fold hydrolase n=1 Tax=Denitrificimonas halotolerans TaxID=3098930 RepID=A0ABU5GPQ5_9GAMM|nr:alpha/beta fold hydrolase [Denitrificimonas sp. JX-1]MDY7218936.1 alpha/beta fold hydrolase [Denitrificimonas sp. JX-1]